MPTVLPNDVSVDGLNVTRAQEGRSLRAYQDVVGVWTIGYGLTNYDKGLPFLPIKQDVTITEQQAEWYLLKSIRDNYLPVVHKALLGGTYAHPQGAIDGGCDFHYNCGGITKATWPKLLGEGDLAAAESSMMAWNRAGGRVLADLTRRRATNWQEVSAGVYGKLSGPEVIDPGANNREVAHGSGDLLTALPTDPALGPNPPPAASSSIKVSGLPAACPDAPSVLKPGMAGPAISAAQNALTTAGLPTPATGKFDSTTLANVMAFQKSHPNLTLDGKIGPATTAALARAASMRKAAGTIAKTAAPSVPGAYVAFHEFMSAHAGNIALGVGISAVLVISGYYLWKHQHDAAAWFNGLIGRVVL